MSSPDWRQKLCLLLFSFPSLPLLSWPFDVKGAEPRVQSPNNTLVKNTYSVSSFLSIFFFFFFCLMHSLYQWGVCVCDRERKPRNQPATTRTSLMISCNGKMILASHTWYAPPANWFIILRRKLTLIKLLLEQTIPDQSGGSRSQTKPLGSVVGSDQGQLFNPGMAEVLLEVRITHFCESYQLKEGSRSILRSHRWKQKHEYQRHKTASNIPFFGGLGWGFCLITGRFFCMNSNYTCPLLSIPSFSK